MKAVGALWLFFWVVLTVGVTGCGGGSSQPGDDLAVGADMVVGTAPMDMAKKERKHDLSTHDGG